MTYEPGLRPSDLRKLADALERRKNANFLPGISAPGQINFHSATGQPLNSYGDNPELLTEIKRQIRLEWDDLRGRALARLDNEIDELRRTIALGLEGSPEEAPVSGIEAPAGRQDASAA